MRFDIKMAAGREEVHEEEVCTYCTTAFEEGGVVVVVVFIADHQVCTHVHVPGQTKHHNTAKVLLGIAHQGVSNC